MTSAQCRPRCTVSALPDDQAWDQGAVLPERLFLGSPGAARGQESAHRLEQLLHPSRCVAHPREAQAILAWGLKASSAKAKEIAERYRLPIWRIEDAFLRSFSPGRSEPAQGLVFDDLGIYYDAANESRLERLILRPLDAAREARAANLICQWREQRVSKYNNAPEEGASLPHDFVLAVDQTRGDLSIVHGLADERSFRRMLESALVENPGCKVVLKVHPEVAAGTKEGHFARCDLLRNPRVEILGNEMHAAGILSRARRVYAVTSQMGFEALLHGKAVRVFGMPFYAGWGLTEDELPPPDRRKQVTLAQVVHAALVDYARYVNAGTGKRCEVEEVISYLGKGSRRTHPAGTPSRDRVPGRGASANRSLDTVYAVGFHPWKKSLLQTFLPGRKIRFVRTPRQVPKKNHPQIATWGMLFDDAQFPEGSLITRYEDGFIRSNGLGARFAPAVSWVADDRGIYYDATRRSNLEDILQNELFPEELLQRAKKLRLAIVRAGLTKYNLGGTPWQRPFGKRKVVLVPGQVESDASMIFGGGTIRTNLGLLKAVRAANPDACIVYKPHPDVVARLRKSGAGEETAADHCDALVTCAPIQQVIDEVDEVHVMTSLSGFEALLRGKAVYTYGNPFYAGWGLTTDKDPPERRTRRLTVDELVAGALIRYPLYRSPQTGRICEAEEAITGLVSRRIRLPRGPLEVFLGLLQHFPLWTRFFAR